MKAFYDNIIPSSVNKLVKPFGIKSEVITLPEGTEQLSIPINQKMQETISDSGVPLFSIAPESIEDKLSRLTPLQRKQAEQSISGINKQIDENQTCHSQLAKGN